ncbi:putative membrane protein [Sphingomonas kyeonggiensis]|uniref:Putative membrane protein n=1 Tax=Sphingomonas kyeonggiensis TaxID=1268553 RepID=A0A7W7K411_9SPHN|nr:TMEM175 family protein [Sphingomonas kyeonggiensis]MBB4840639.1 putative membrane protein [Sphingomonas kyeonggiensis]
MEDKPHAAGPAHGLERMAFFSDAVFAIAITLLVIEIHVPHIEAPYTDEAFLKGLAKLTPSFIGFLVSFFAIGLFWIGHHRAFACARHWSPKLFAPNLFLLCSIAAMPFFTAFSSEYYGHRVPAAFYCGWMVVISIFNILVQRILTAPPVIDEHLPAEQPRMIRQRGLAALLGSLTAFVTSLFVPPLGQVALITIPLWRLLIARLAPSR